MAWGPGTRSENKRSRSDAQSGGDVKIVAELGVWGGWRWRGGAAALRGRGCGSYYPGSIPGSAQGHHPWVLNTHFPGKTPEVKWSEGRLVVSDSLWPHGLYTPCNSPGQNTRAGSFSLLQGIFPTKGSNPGFLHCRRILYQLSHKGSPRMLEWVPYPFSSGSSWARNQTGVTYIAGRFFTNWAIRESPRLLSNRHQLEWGRASLPPASFSWKDARGKDKGSPWEPGVERPSEHLPPRGSCAGCSFEGLNSSVFPVKSSRCRWTRRKCDKSLDSGKVTRGGPLLACSTSLGVHSS